MFFSSITQRLILASLNKVEISAGLCWMYDNERMWRAAVDKHVRSTASFPRPYRGTWFHRELQCTPGPHPLVCVYVPRTPQADAARLTYLKLLQGRHAGREMETCRESPQLYARSGCDLGVSKRHF